MAQKIDPIFFLGGRDLEMVEIRRLLEEFAPGRFHDKELSWGAKTSHYRREIDHALKQGQTPVLVELEDDLGLPTNRIVIVDHHNLEEGRRLPSALRQVFDLLGLPEKKWTRRRRLVAANDRGHVKAMLEEGADFGELLGIRAQDRVAQGITEAEERQARESVAKAETLAGGRLTVVRCPHSRTAAVTDWLEEELGGPGFENLLVASPTELNFFGSGRLVKKLDDAIPGGWYGGELPERGFWGIEGVEAGELVARVVEVLIRELGAAGTGLGGDG